jgi:Arc/MetJ-type ribon-helix-helix transcriptional regulator
MKQSASGGYPEASEVVREALRRRGQEEISIQEDAIVDPDNVQGAVLHGLRSVERGDFIELSTQEELQRYFDDIIHRGKKRLLVSKKMRARVKR